MDEGARIHLHVGEYGRPGRIGTNAGGSMRSRRHGQGIRRERLSGGSERPRDIPFRGGKGELEEAHDGVATQALQDEAGGGTVFSVLKYRMHMETTLPRSLK